MCWGLIKSTPKFNFKIMEMKTKTGKTLVVMKGTPKKVGELAKNFPFIARGKNNTYKGFTNRKSMKNWLQKEWSKKNKEGKREWDSSFSGRLLNSWEREWDYVIQKYYV